MAKKEIVSGPLRFGRWALRVCGLSSIETDIEKGHSSLNETPAEWLKKFNNGEIAPLDDGNDDCGNLLFAVSSTDLIQQSGHHPEFKQYLLNHKNTKIIHAYKNNAHGPSIVYICMYHKDPEAVDAWEHTNNIQEYKQKTYKEDSYQYHLKKPGA